MDFSESEQFFMKRRTFFFGLSFKFEGLESASKNKFENIIKYLGGSVNEASTSLIICPPSYARKNKNKKCYSSKYILDSVNSRKVLNPEHYRHDVNKPLENEYCCVDAQYIFRTNSCKRYYENNKCHKCLELELKDLNDFFLISEKNSSLELFESAQDVSFKLEENNSMFSDISSSLNLSNSKILNVENPPELELDNSKITNYESAQDVSFNLEENNSFFSDFSSSLNLSNSQILNVENPPELEVDNSNSETPDSLDLVSSKLEVGERLCVSSNECKVIEKPLETLPKLINNGASTSKKSKIMEKNINKSDNLINEKFLQDSDSSSDSNSVIEIKIIAKKKKNQTLVPNPTFNLKNRRINQREKINSGVSTTKLSEYEYTSESELSLSDTSLDDKNYYDNIEYGWWSYLPKPKKLITPTFLKNNITTKRGKTFTEDEKKLMISYLVVNKSIHLASSRKIYHAMHFDGYLAHRTVESLNNNMRRSILPNIQEFHLPRKIKEMFLRNL